MLNKGYTNPRYHVTVAIEVVCSWVLSMELALVHRSDI